MKTRRPAPRIALAGRAEDVDAPFEAVGGRGFAAGLAALDENAAGEPGADGGAAWAAATTGRYARAAALCRESARGLKPGAVASQLVALHEMLLPRVETARLLKRLGMPNPDGARRRSGGPNPRRTMVDLQQQIAFETPKRVLAEFGRRWKRAAGPEDRARWRVHRGEVKLWLGDYAGALADISAGLDFAVLKWPPVGCAAACLLSGRLKQADAWLERARAGGTPPGAWLSWRGELRRLQGRFREAVADLERCGRPGMMPFVGVNLGLAVGELGDRRRQRALLARLTQDHYAIAATAIVRCGYGEARTIGELPEKTVAEALETVLTLLRGNRSHWFATWMPADGDLRVLSMARRDD